MSSEWKFVTGFVSLFNYLCSMLHIFKTLFVLLYDPIPIQSKIYWIDWIVHSHLHLNCMLAIICTVLVHIPDLVFFYSVGFHIFLSSSCFGHCKVVKSTFLGITIAVKPIGSCHRNTEK